MNGILMLSGLLFMNGWDSESVWKKPCRGVPIGRCSEYMQQIYRRTPMPKCDFEKVAEQLY